MHNKSQTWIRGLAVMLALLGVASSAHAVLLGNGLTVGTPGTTDALRPELGGPVIHDALIPFNVIGSDGATYTGTLQDRVVFETGTGTLDFYQSILNVEATPAIPSTAGGVTVTLTTVSRTDFQGYITDVDYRIDGLGSIAPINASRSGDGITVLFNYDNQIIDPTNQTRFAMIKTDALFYDVNGTTRINLNNGAAFVDLVTAQPVPEPSTLVLGSLAGIALLGYFWRSRTVA